MGETGAPFILADGPTTTHIHGSSATPYFDARHVSSTGGKAI